MSSPHDIVLEKEQAIELTSADQVKSDSSYEDVSIPYIVQYFGRKAGMTADGKNENRNTVKTYEDGHDETVAAWDWKKAKKRGEVLNMARCEPGEVDETCLSKTCGISFCDSKRRNKLEPGLNKPEAELYSVWDTREDDLGDFGQGVGMYFKTLRYVAIVLCVVFIINIPSMSYFANNYGQWPSYPDYEIDEDSAFWPKIPGGDFWVPIFGFIPAVPLIGTAICPAHPTLLAGSSGEGSGKIESTMKGGALLLPVYKGGYKQAFTTELVEHPSKFEDFDGNEYSQGTRWVNDCPFSANVAWCDLVGSLVLLIFVLVLGKVQSEQAEEIDEQNQTAEDYSVMVEDPGDTEDDQSPEKWKEYFSQFGEVVSIALVKKNGYLMNLLTERKALIDFVRKEGWDNISDDDFVPEKLRESLLAGEPYADAHEFAGGQALPKLPDEPGEKFAPPEGIRGYFAKKNAVFSKCRQLGEVNRKIKNRLEELMKRIHQPEDGKSPNLENARVYATFAFENDQRFCLDVLSSGSFWAFWDIPTPSPIIWFLKMYNNFGLSADFNKSMNPFNWTYYLGFNGAKPAAWKDRKDAFESNANSKVKFGDNVLMVTGAPEPADIRWECLDEEPVDVAKVAFCTTVVGLAVTTFLGYLCILIMTIPHVGTTIGALGITICNTILPTVMKKLNSYEKHATHTATEASLLFKLVAARLILFGLVPYLSTPWHTTLSDGTTATDLNNNHYYSSTTLPGNIKKILTIIAADAFLGPLIRVLNIGGNIKYFYGTANAKTQESLESMFKGTSWMLAERFSDMSKTIYVTLFFAALAPIAYLLCAIAMVANYCVDKYLLLRVWQVPPNLDASIVKTTRAHIAFFVLLHIVVSLWYYAGWPFDGVVCDNSVDGSFDGSDYKKYHPSPNAKEYSEWASGLCQNVGDSPAYNIYLSNMRVTKFFFIWWTKNMQYQSDQQQNAVHAFQIFAIIAFIFISIFYMGAAFQVTIYTAFFGVPKDTTDVALRPKAKDADNGKYFIPGLAGKEIDSSTVEDLEFYVPMFMHPVLDVPQIAIYHPDMRKTVNGKNVHISEWNEVNAPEQNKTEEDGEEKDGTKKYTINPWSVTPPPPEMAFENDELKGVESWFPAKTALNWNENASFDIFYHENNLWNDPILSHIPESTRLRLFSSVTTYKIGNSKGQSARMSLFDADALKMGLDGVVAEVGVEAPSVDGIPLPPPGETPLKSTEDSNVMPPPPPTAE